MSSAFIKGGEYAQQSDRMPSDGTTHCVPVYLNTNLASALERLSQPQLLEVTIHRSFVIGGASLYGDTLALPPTANSFVDRVLLTRILSPAFEGCDVFMPDFVGKAVGDSRPWRQVSHTELQEWVGFDVAAGTQEENGVQYEYQMWVR